MNVKKFDEMGPWLKKLSKWGPGVSVVRPWCFCCKALEFLLLVMTLSAGFVILSNFVMRSFVTLLALMISLAMRTSLEVIKLFSCSTQMSMKFQLLIKTKIIKKTILAF